MPQTVVQLKVGMSCKGCVSAVERVLGKMEGNVQPKVVLQTVSKTGKKTSFWEAAEPPAAEPESKGAAQPESKAAEPPAAEPESKGAAQPPAAEPESKSAAQPESKRVETVTAA